MEMMRNKMKCNRNNYLYLRLKYEESKKEWKLEVRVRKLLILDLCFFDLY